MDTGDQRGLAAQDEETRCTSASEGLEEGEVEGETLLIVESEDQASVDLSHDQSGDSLNSDVGEDGEGSWNEDMSFYCDKCHKWIPAAQLRGEQPSYLKGDNFFKFTCSDCAEDGKESFERMRLTWQQVVMLAMYNLSLEGTGRQGYFRWKEDICAFISRHWTFLLGSRKKTSTWWSTVAGCLSVGSPTFFRSGAQEFGEPGWWKLVQNRPPTLRPEGEKSSAASLKAKAVSKPSLDPIITVEGLRKRGSRNPVENAIQLKEKRSRTQEAKEIRRAQKEAAGFLDRSASSTPVKLGNRVRRSESYLEKGEVIDFSSLSSSDRTPLTSPSPSPSPDFSTPGTPASHSATPSLLSEADLIPDVMPPQALFHDDEELDPEGVIDPGMEYIPPPSMPLATGTIMVRKKIRPAELIKQELESEDEERGRDGEEDEGRDEGLLSAGQGRGIERRKVLQDKGGGCVSLPTPRYTFISLYEERMLLHRLEACPQALAVTPQAKRLHRKLFVRQAKRERGLPLLDVDQAVSATLSLVGGVYGAQGGLASHRTSGEGKYRTTSQDLRILDRFQSTVTIRKGFYQPTVSFWHRLMGTDACMDQTIKSPYTSRVLKPYIRRDYESRPLKLRLLSEIRAYPHKKEPSWVAEPDAPIDYCYVRPNHIPSVNSMCQDIFWPGIDLSECLQYPDFSVVVLYKKVVIGFGFMVPDVKYNEAYISFLLVHPEWRRAGIATFMIYHLIQTCMGKDVTLHVSASNPAMLLYQKFGFKTEEYILDFYDKYYPVDSKECRHAFFLRLRR
ncbi:cysteine-rich protein 2-binding protein isoform X1 [Sinocyclocheilus rhinocerous]|uniref:cysteine-rich protein 2-binding protein isoform X1 n=1 Tax=Sinocyclocheilus rhinocerous TaxID=307959 RepID=UPI0007B9E996|nr:PREDICTED: cysteine-rich protein 2-binding protein isoform X1 [Sinocyclocheilus rhinocerous]XP_016377404.1 PREDICTED: cysteine-rich protein 2-binding protein isoform X1 [Sinocyclocheilus rhinocerous]XP_016377405.1 PREDICTED: cysteine-rich protein 2-binding protein isoform X1 [Sinocyclocheilus rhinocerous]